MIEMGACQHSFQQSHIGLNSHGHHHAPNDDQEAPSALDTFLASASRRGRSDTVLPHSLFSLQLPAPFILAIYLPVQVFRRGTVISWESAEDLSSVIPFSVSQKPASSLQTNQQPLDTPFASMQPGERGWSVAGARSREGSGCLRCKQ